MDLSGMIKQCSTLAQLKNLEERYTLTEEEQNAVFDQRLKIFVRLLDWSIENESLGLEPGISDSWTPTQREKFIEDWLNDDPIIQTIQMGYGEKRRFEEMNDDGAGTSDEVRDDNRYFTVKHLRQVRIQKFATTGLDYAIQFTNTLSNLELSEQHNHLHEIFQSLLDTVTRDVPMHDQVRFVLRTPQLEYPISLPFMPRGRLTSERVLAEIERVVQSNHEFKLNDSVSVNIVHVEMPNGGTGTKRREINLDKYLTNKRSIVRIQNTDDICLARALVVAIAKLENDEQYRTIINSKISTLQSRRAYELHEKCSVPLVQCGLSEIKQFQTHLAEYQINIVSKEHQNSIIFSGPDREKRIYLYAHDNHYDVITSMPAFFARKMFCHTCKKGYDKNTDHLCGDSCKACRFQNCPIISWVECKDCMRNFKSQECYNRHKETVGNGKSICASLIKCKHCGRVVKRNLARPESHNCGLVRCIVCREYVDETHRCYMKPEKTKMNETAESDDLCDSEADETNNDGSAYNQLLFFDFECIQENGTHTPNLCVVHDEAGNEHVFQGENTKDDFCEWLFQNENAGSIVMAHNFQGYDGYFILQYLHKNGIVPEVIMRGAKLLTIYVPMLKIKFIDSLCFIPMKLANFPKTFGIPELAKGYFPHLFNRTENQTYIGPIPSSPYYHPDGMSPSEREKFLSWHKNLQQNNYVFNFQDEILKYCRSDVDILRRCCMEFRELFRSVTDVDPFEKCLTIASACNLVFRKKFLREGTIAIIPPNGYRPLDKHSILALKWLSFTAERNNVNIQHVRNSGEKRVGNYRLDGFHEETNTVYEVQGCFWHGCLKCYARDTVNTVNSKTMHELYQATLDKTMYLKSLNFNVVEIWECQINQQLKTDADMRAYFDNFQVVDPLEPRDAFYGGRTNATKLFHECQDDEQIKYFDFTSLYPHCNKSTPSVIGHPQIITENFQDLSSYFGLVKCTVLPPRGLFHPVLPYRTQGKLMFPLCKTCADTCSLTTCTHTEEERAIQGTWTSVELQKAIEKGYRVLRVHEVWHFQQQSSELFKDYVDTFLKIKQESSGYPSECVTDEQRREYIQQYFEHEGINLDPDKIERNSGLRALAKLMLNSFWGKCYF
jgi:hypothetical protein